MPWSVLPEYPNGTIGQSCLVCHSDLRNLGNTSRHERCVSTGIFIEFEGLVVLCESCVVDIANQLGMVPADKVDNLRKNNRELGRQNHALNEEVEQAKATIRGLSKLFKPAAGAGGGRA